MDRSKFMIARTFLLLIICFTAVQAFGQDESPLVRLFDTGAPSAAPLAEAAVAKAAGWLLVAEDNTTHTFAGDAVFMNDKLAVVLRWEGHAAEIYAKTSSGFRQRAGVGLAGAGEAAGAARAGFKIIENNSGAVRVEAATLGFRLTTGEATLEIRPGAGARAINVQTKTSFVVVPDFFGDDLVFGAEARGRGLPAENFCLNLIQGGDAIVMNVWQSNRQEARLTASGNQITCLEGKSIWLAFMECPGLWRAGEAADKAPAPFPAKWRCSFVRANAVADSWDCDRGPSPEQAAATHTGPLVVYPIDRTTTTPLTAVCPTDVMRDTLGVGPCQYILAVEGLGAEDDPTPNNVMNWVEKLFEQQKDKKSAGEIRERLEQMAAHVGQARARIERYGACAEETRKLLAGKPDAASALAIADDLKRFADAGLAPRATAEQARKLAGAVSALIGTANALAPCRVTGGELRAIGAIQDRALARCRMAVRRLKMETEPAGEVRRLAEAMLNATPETGSQKEGVK